MARARMIKPEFWSDETLMKVSRDSRLLYIGMWTHADDYGVLFNSNRKLLGDIFPFDGKVAEKDIDKWKNELIKNNFLITYKNYLIIRSWKNHQRVSHPSKPLLTEDVDALLATIVRHSGDNPETLAPEVEREREVGVGGGGGVESVLVEWNYLAKTYDLPEIKTITKSRREKLRLRIKEGLDLNEITSSLKNQPFLTGSNDRGWKISFDWLIINDTNWVKVTEHKYVDIKKENDVMSADARQTYKNGLAAIKQLEEEERNAEKGNDN